MTAPNIETTPIRAQHQGTAFEFTVVQKPNQGSPRQLDVIIGGRPFLYFFGRAKKYKARRRRNAVAPAGCQLTKYKQSTDIIIYQKREYVED